MSVVEFCFAWIFHNPLLFVLLPFASELSEYRKQVPFGRRAVYSGKKLGVTTLLSTNGRMHINLKEKLETTDGIASTMMIRKLSLVHVQKLNVLEKKRIEQKKEPKKRKENVMP